MSKNQKLVAGQHVELSPLQQEPEVVQGGHHQQELPVKGAEPRLCVSQLPAEERERLPLTAGGPLLQGRPYKVVACINCQGELCILDGVGQVGGVCEGHLGGHKRLSHLLGPLQLAVLAAHPTCGICELLEDAGLPLQVPAVEVQHAQEAHQLGLGAGHGAWGGP